MKKYTRSMESRMSNAEKTIMIKMRRTHSLGGVFNYDNSNHYEGSSSSTAVIIITFINQYTKILYPYTNLSLPTFFWKNGYILFYFSGITTTLKG